MKISDESLNSPVTAGEDARAQQGDFDGDEGHAGDGEGHQEDEWSSGGYTFDMDAGWELRPNESSPNRAIARWCVVYATVDDDSSRVAGIAAGYAGGGSFVMQRFHAEFASDHSDYEEGDLSSLRFEDRMEDAITHEECDFEEDCCNATDSGSNLYSVVRAAEQVFWRWHEGDIDEGFQGNNLLLRNELWDHPQNERDGDMIRLASDCNPWIREICEHLGLTAAPSFDTEDDD